MSLYTLNHNIVILVNTHLHSSHETFQVLQGSYLLHAHFEDDEENGGHTKQLPDGFSAAERKYIKSIKKRYNNYKAAREAAKEDDIDQEEVKVETTL